MIIYIGGDIMIYDKFDEKTEFYFNRRSGDKIKSILLDSHYHNLYEIYYIVNGNCRYFIDGKLYDLQDGDVMLIPEGIIHNTEYKNTPHTRLLINCSRRFIPSSVAKILPQIQYHYRNPEISMEIHELLCRIEDEYNKKDEFTDEVLRSYVHMLFVLLARNRHGHESVEVKNGYIEKAIRYVNENYMMDISLTDVAKLCSVSAEHFSRIFTKETGLGFCEYINIVRMKKAETLIRSGQKASIAQIATSCGFNDSNYFSLKFKKMYGMSPKKMQKMSK